MDQGTVVSVIDYEEYTWSATSLLCDRTHQISHVETYVFAESVLCLGGIKEHSNEAWKEKRIDGDRVDNIPRTHNIWPPRTDSFIQERTTV